MKQCSFLLGLVVLAGACALDRSGRPGVGGTGGGPSAGGAGPGGGGGGGAGGASTSSTTGPGGGSPCAVFPGDNPWNTDISGAPVDTRSDDYIESIGVDEPLFANFGVTTGIPYFIVDSSVAKTPLTFLYGAESDPGPYPIPTSYTLDEDGHLIMLHEEECVLYELLGYGMTPNYAEAGAIWDLKINATRPPGWTSADSAGLPIYPGLIRHEEVVEIGEIRHALRFSAVATQRAYVAPANHYVGNDTSPNRPPMGLRLRLESDFDIERFPAPLKVILVALKKYGMFLASNGGNLYLSGAPHPGWAGVDFSMLGEITADDFEAVQTGMLVTD
jgi:hypothetical protein